MEWDRDDEDADTIMKVLPVSTSNFDDEDPFRAVVAAHAHGQGDGVQRKRVPQRADLKAVF